MAKRTADATARSRIRTYLREHGPVEDSGGGATARLRAAVGYQGNAIAFIQLLTAMDEAGEIIREIRGKRTYAIGLAAASAADLSHRAVAAEGESPGASGAVIDYDRLAQALLRELGRVLASAWPDVASPAPVQVTAASGPDGVLDLAQERDLLRTQRDEYASQLGSARRQLDSLLALYVRGNKRESTDTVDALEQALIQLRGVSRAEAGKRAV